MIIFPPIYPKQLDDAPMVFLAGPIQGAPMWQETAIRRLSRKSSCHIACPRHGIGGFAADYEYDMDSSEFAQYDWETHFLNRTATNGVILFWLAKEEYHVPGRSYGQTTRQELFEWKERMMNGKGRIVLGIEKGWTGERYIRRRLSQDLPELRVHTSLDGTLKEALQYLPSRQQVLPLQHA